MDIELKPVKQGCTGYFFRGYKNIYATKEGKIEQKMGLRLLKRMSCPGCSECGKQLLDELPEYFSCVDLEPIEDGAIYQMWDIWSGGTYEYPNECDLEIDWKKVFDRNGRPVKEEPPKTNAQMIEEKKDKIKQLQKQIELLEEFGDD